jgi:hypothetical protein
MSSITFKRKNKGYALMISVAVLAVMTVMVITMTIASNFELRMAQSYLDKSKADMLVHAAVERAVADIQYAADGPLYNSYDALSEDWYSDPPYTGTVDLGNGITGTWYVDAIYDCSSMINIADGNTHFGYMLNNLNDYLSNPLTAFDITEIVNNAPYETRQQVKRYLSGTDAEKETKFNAIKDYITAFSYVDETVINPQDVTTPYDVEPRAPVNINTAPKEVLVAVLDQIKTIHNCPRCGGDGYINGVYAGHYGCPACGGQWSPRINGTGNLEIGESGDPNEAALLADHIISYRSSTPFRTYEQLYSVLKSCSDIDERDADLVLANANPNTDFSWIRNPAWYSNLGDVGKYVIDWNKDGSVGSGDKGLTLSTTEFSFNSGGYFELQVKSRITDSLGNKLAEKGAMVVVKAYDVYRESTQDKFESGSLSNILTFPQPVDAGVSAADYSGTITLDTQTYSSPSSGDYMRANYESTVSADAGGGTLTPVNMAGEPTSGSVTNFTSRGDLMPDGLIADYFDSVKPKYWPAGNVSADEGTYIIWYKPCYPGNDTRAYGDNDQDRKMIRLTSDVQIPGQSGSNGWPYLTLWFWSDGNDLWSGAQRGGGRYNGSDWSFPYGWWWGWTNGGFPCWNKGEWQQLVLSWHNPDDFDPATPDDELNSTLYNATNNPLVLYSNGSKLKTTTYYYHSAYGNTTTNRVANVGCESDSWNSNANELSFAVIGSVRFFPTKLSDADVQADYASGIYQTSGTYSNTLSLPNSVTWGTIAWSEGIPSLGGNVLFNIDTGDGWQGNFDNVNIHAGTNGISTAATTDESDTISYRANLSSSTNKDTPVLQNIFITYLDGHEVIFWRVQ